MDRSQEHELVHISEIYDIECGNSRFKDDILFVRCKGGKVYKIKTYILLQAFQNGWDTFRVVLKRTRHHLEPAI